MENPTLLSFIDGKIYPVGRTTSRLDIYQALEGLVANAGSEAQLAQAILDITTLAAAKADTVHTHAISEVAGLQGALNAKLDDSQAGVSGGLATLDSGGKVPTAQLPASSATPFTVTISNEPVKRIARTITSVGVTPSDTILVSSGVYVAANDNDNEWLDIDSINAVAGNGNFTMTIIFLVPTMGDINLTWRKI
jgi:hypothetical protein